MMRTAFQCSTLVLPLLFCVACGDVVVDRGGAGAAVTEGPSCAAGTEENCPYSGPAGTEGVGVCAGGSRVCEDDGSEWGACAGEVVPSAEVCGTADDETCDGEGACLGKPVWARDLEMDGSSGAGQSVAADPWGNVLVSGNFAGDFQVGDEFMQSEGGSAFVLKLDPSGKALWARKSKEPAYATAIGADGEGNVFVAGTHYGELDLGSGPIKPGGLSGVFVAKYDPSGKLFWARGFGGPGDQWATDLAVDSTGNVVVIGGIHDGSDFGGGYKPTAGGLDVFVLKLNGEGELLWALPFGSEDNDWGLGVDVSEGGAVAITGSFSGTMDLGGGALVTQGSDDIFVAKLTADGKHIWSRSFGGPMNDLGKGIAVTKDGTIVVGGLSSGPLDLGTGVLSGGGTYDSFVAWYKSDGDALGAQVLGTAGTYSQVLGVAADSAGNAVIMGTMKGTVSFGGEPLEANLLGSSVPEDVFVAKLDPGMQHVYSFLVAATETEQPNGLAVDGLGSLLMTGAFSGELSFGGQTLVSSVAKPAVTDMFVMKWTP